jgi:hypothetical protein
MTDFKNKLKEVLNEKRLLSVSTCTTYSSLLYSLQKKLNGNDLTISFYETHKDNILKHIELLEKPQTKKTLLSALYVLTGDEGYREVMMDNVHLVNENYKQQKTDPERLKNIKSFDEIKAIHNKIKDAYKNNPSNSNLNDLIISYVSTGVLDGLPPRRVLDYAVMKILRFNRDTDNYFDKGKFYFNQFKTKGIKGKQEIEAPKELVLLINKRKKIMTNDFLIENESGEQYTQSSLSKKIKNCLKGIHKMYYAQYTYQIYIRIYLL